MEYLSAHILSARVRHEERIGWLKAVHGDSELRQWFLEVEGSYRALVDMWRISFDLIQEPTPDWNEGLEKFQKHAPFSATVFGKKG